MRLEMSYWMHWTSAPSAFQRAAGREMQLLGGNVIARRAKNSHPVQRHLFQAVKAGHWPHAELVPRGVATLRWGIE